MDHHTGHVMTLANSIIGVGVLAMPYCFKEVFYRYFYHKFLLMIACVSVRHYTVDSDAFCEQHNIEVGLPFFVKICYYGPTEDFRVFR